MKYIKTFEEKIEEELFLKQGWLKSKLLDDKSFAEGDVHQALMNIAHEKWDDNMSYENILDWIEKNMGKMPLFAMYFGKYNYQVCNGGHKQYFENGYASSESVGYGGSYTDIDKHEIFWNLFKDLDMKTKLKIGQEAYDIISKFELDLLDEETNCEYCDGNGEENCETCEGNGTIQCDECGGDGEIDDKECENCEGNGMIECGECEGKGKFKCGNCNGEGVRRTGRSVAVTDEWGLLDTRWYNINDEIMEEFNEYLKSLTINGEKIEDLIPLAKSTQNYNL